MQVKDVVTQVPPFWHGFAVAQVPAKKVAKKFARGLSIDEPLMIDHELMETMYRSIELRKLDPSQPPKRKTALL